MIEQTLRPWLQRYGIEPLLRCCRPLAQLHPLWLTLAGLITGVAVWPALVYQQVGVAISLLLVSGFCDCLDGSLARLQNSTSGLGCVLDIMCDRIVEFAILMGLYYVAPEARGTEILWMLGSAYLCVTSFLVVGIFSQHADKLGKSFYYSPGIMERFESFVLFALMMLWPNFFNVFAMIFTVLVLLTAVIRLTQFTLLSANH